MSRNTKTASRKSLSAIAAIAADGDFIPLGQALRLLKRQRSTFYRHPEIPRITKGGRVFVSKTAIDALVASRERGLA